MFGPNLTLLLDSEDDDVRDDAVVSSGSSTCFEGLRSSSVVDSEAEAEGDIVAPDVGGAANGEGFLTDSNEDEEAVFSDIVIGIFGIFSRDRRMFAMVALPTRRSCPTELKAKC